MEGGGGSQRPFDRRCTFSAYVCCCNIGDGITSDVTTSTQVRSSRGAQGLITRKAAAKASERAHWYFAWVSSR